MQNVKVVEIQDVFTLNIFESPKRTEEKEAKVELIEENSPFEFLREIKEETKSNIGSEEY